MPHLGKNWPRQFLINYIDSNLAYPASGPTYRMRLMPLTSFSSGTVAALWIGSDVISGPPAHWSMDSTWTIYTFTNGTDPLATIDVRMQWHDNGSTSPTNPHYDWDLVYEPRYNGVLLARNQRDVPPDRLFLNPHSDSQVGPGWNDKTDVAAWNQISFRVGAASWADVPSYHPYRH